MDRCCWVTGSPAGAGQAEPGTQMAERSSSWLETQPQSDGMERGPSWAALGQDKVTLACHPALTQEPGDPPPGPEWPRGRDGSLHCPAGDCHPLLGTPLKKWGVCWGLRASLGHSVCWALPTGIGRSNSGSASFGIGLPRLSPGVLVSASDSKSGFLIPSWLGLTHQYLSLSSVACKTVCSPFF